MPPAERAIRAPAALPARGEVHLWTAVLGALRPQLTVLDPHERRRALRLRDPGVAARFVASRGLLRQVLSRYLDVAPEAVTFRRAPSAQSILAGAEDLYFSLSRAGDHCAVALAVEPVGVDAESYDTPPDMDRLVEQIGAEDERAALATCGSADRARLSHELWTNKEAVLKALGAGFHLDPRGAQVGWGEGMRRIHRAEPHAPIDCDLRRFHLGDWGGAVALLAPVERVVPAGWR